MYSIYADMGGDFSQDIIDKINIIPMDIIVDKETILNTDDFKNLSREKFLEILKSKDMSTSMINSFTFKEYFKKSLEEEKDILYICLSSGLSGQYLQAKIAADELLKDFPQRKIEVVDSLAATCGISILVKAALKNRKSNINIEKNAEILREKAKFLKHIFIVDDLFHLQRGGRLSVTAALMGTAIKIKPILRVDAEGKLTVKEKTRGIKNAYKKLKETYFEDRNLNSKELFISQCANEEGAQILKEMILEKDPDVKIEIIEMTPIISIHTGQGLLTTIYEGSDLN